MSRNLYRTMLSMVIIIAAGLCGGVTSAQDEKTKLEIPPVSVIKNVNVCLNGGPHPV